MRCSTVASGNQMSTTTKFRCLFVSTMVVTATALGLITYSVLSSMESNTATLTFESVAASALEQAQAIALRKQQGADSLATALSFAFPSAEQWPLEIGLRGYTQLAQKIAKLSATAGHGFMTVVPNDQIPEFEAHAQQLYQQLNYPEEAGYSEFGFGIWGMDPSFGFEDKRFHDDASVANKWDSRYNITVPFLQHMNTFKKPSLLLRNIHQFALRGALMENIIDCGKQAEAALAFSIQAEEEAAIKTAEETQRGVIPLPSPPKCGGVTDFTELYVRPGPAAVFIDPIFPADDPTTVVGFIGTSINWEEVLTNVVPDFVDGVDCVISDHKGNSYTYVINQGKPTLLGEGDLHSQQYDDFAQDIELTAKMETGATSSVKYTLTVYPTAPYYQSYSTSIPLIVSLGFVAVIVACTCVFFVYDAFMKHESHQRKVILQMKRKFVRFISHEIRTPLNVVCMGLDLMMTELRDQLDQLENKNKQHKPNPNLTQSTAARIALVQKDPKPKDNNEAVQEELDTTASTATTTSSSSSPSPPPATTAPPTPPPPQPTFDTRALMNLAIEIHENSQNAVAVLSDLLNYDKVESGTFDLEFGRVPIFQSAQKTIKEFSIHARNRDIAIHTHTHIETSTGNDHPSQDQFHDDLEQAQPPQRLQQQQLMDRRSRNLFVLGDERRLNLVVRNLVSNALKFCQGQDIHVSMTHIPDGLPDAKIRPDMIKNKTSGNGSISSKDPSQRAEMSNLMNISRRAGAVRIAVKDNGVGLSEDQLALLFNEGVQFNPETLQHGGGSGIGLCLVREIVKQHEGSIVATSQGLGTGSEFHIVLPLYETTEDSPHSDAMTNTTIDQDVSQSRGFFDHTHQVLIVDDVITNTKMLKRLLERAGHHCSTASNGKEAIEAYLANEEENAGDSDSGGGDNINTAEQRSCRRFDTILMDFEMPELNGPDATARLRELGCTASIFGVTGNALAEDVATFKASGADKVLLKPINLPALDSAWEEMEEQKRLTRFQENKKRVDGAIHA